MADQGTKVLDLPVKAAVASANDKLVFVYGAGTANAQTALISIQNAITAYGATRLLSDPSTNNALTVQQGQLLFSNNYGYYAIANNTLVRWPLQTF